MNQATSKQAAAFAIIALAISLHQSRPISADEPKVARPNILFAIADDWGLPHAGAYGDPVVKTPAFDRLAREGVLFHHAYVSSPSCTPSRGAILTGQWHWRLDGAANLWSVFPDKFVTYPELLEKAGYAVGVTSKGWGPGRTETPGRNLVGKPYESFQAFLDQRPAGKPFCFWLGSSDPHRPYVKGSGEKSGMQLEKIKLPACFPDDPDVRGDVADYYFEVQRFDRLVGSALAALEKIGELDNTIVLMTGDHGMPFPRGKSNLYDTGTRVPLAVRWPAGGVKHGTAREDFVSLADIAPTLLECAGVAKPAGMTGFSFLPVLKIGPKEPRVDPFRDHVLFGKERHVPGQEAPDMGGYPCRGIRTLDYLYIRNFRPDRWPNGTPDYEHAAVPGAWFADTDNGPTKTYMIENRDQDAAHRRLYDLAFAKRPAEELYDLKRDPDQLTNIAAEPAYAAVKEKLAAQLTDQLRATADPRILGHGDKFDDFPYLGSVPQFPGWEAKKKQLQ
jgi:N-sulfoglucosamine sulfohydrolase